MRSDHDKLDRQIDELLGKHYDKEDDYTEDDGSRQVIVDRKYAYDDIKGDTRKIYELDDLKDDEEEVEEEIVKPTRMSRVARLEEEYEDEEKPTYLVKEDKDEDNINFPLLIIGALFFIVAFVSMVVFFVYF